MENRYIFSSLVWYAGVTLNIGLDRETSQNRGSQDNGIQNQIRSVCSVLWEKATPPRSSLVGRSILGGESNYRTAYSGEIRFHAERLKESVTK